jgi:hypothetical protein
LIFRQETNDNHGVKAFRMSRRKFILYSGGLLIISAAMWLAWPVDCGPLYQGRHMTDWVDAALHDDENACQTVLKIGPPAVPYLARQGFNGRSHSIPSLTTSRVQIFGDHHPRLRKWLKLDDWDFCVGRHASACCLLDQMGTNAQAAVPAVARCLISCPELHYIDEIMLIDTLGYISGTNQAGIPALGQVARWNDSASLVAAAVAYRIDGRTNLMVETCGCMAQKDPRRFAEELWDIDIGFPAPDKSEGHADKPYPSLRDDHRLNQYLVPLFEKFYYDPRLDEAGRKIMLLSLEIREQDAAATLARMHVSPAGKLKAQ